MTFAQEYVHLLDGVLRHGFDEKNNRTGVMIKALECYTFHISLGDGVLPTCGIRQTKPHIAAAELAWCLLGHNHIDWLRKHTKVWDPFADVTDCAACDGTGVTEFLDSYTESVQANCEECGTSGKTYWLEQAYGNRWRNTFGRDQLAMAIRALRHDSTDRRIWISSWDPATDGLGASGQKTVPCPVGFTLSILNGKLNSTFVIRSSDLYMGLPYDVMRHALLMSAVAAEIGIKSLGIMQVSIAHPHIYQPHFDIAKSLVDGRKLVVPAMHMPKMTTKDIVDDPDGYVGRVREEALWHTWPPAAIKMDVVR